MMLIYAHRGLSGRYPENTLLAFQRALAVGVDGIELDVHASADGVPVVIHDRDVARTTNGRGHVDEMLRADLQTLDAGGGELVPTLAAVLDLVGAAVHLDIEIKGRGIEGAVLDTLAGFSSARWAISSFDWDTLRVLRGLDQAAELWPLADKVDEPLFSVAAELTSPAVSLLAEAYDAVSAASLHTAGLRTVVWTVNDAAEAVRVRDLGATALCTDVPEVIRPVIA